MNPWKAFQNRSTARTTSSWTRAGEVSQRMVRQPDRSNERNDAAATFTFGNVWARIWVNRSRNGTEYMRISLHRIEDHNGSRMVRNNFRPDDFNDIIRAVRRCHIWLKQPRQ